jgi:tetrahydromethanopterin S-methyltransferase subunit A
MIKSIFCSTIRTSVESIQSNIIDRFRQDNSLLNLFDAEAGLNFLQTIIADCRTYTEKKLELNDDDLETYLLNDSSQTRRNAVSTELENNNMLLLEFKMFAIREQYLRSFII